MQKLVAVAVLGAALAFGTGAAFASDSVDYTGPSQPIKSVPTVSQAQTDHSMVAGGDTGMGPRVYEQLRDENFGS